MGKHTYREYFAGIESWVALTTMLAKLEIVTISQMGHMDMRYHDSFLAKVHRP